MQPEGAPPVERLIVERAVLTPGGIRLSVLNDGPDPVTIAQVTVDDAYWAFTAEENARSSATSAAPVSTSPIRGCRAKRTSSR